MLKTVFDPEIPVNIYDLGLIYRIDISDDGVCVIDMTLTAPSGPAADFLMESNIPQPEAQPHKGDAFEQKEIYG